VSAERPSLERVEIRFARPCAVGAGGVVALEDYACALTQAAAAEAIAAEGGGDRLVGLVLHGPAPAPRGNVLDDIEAFARDLADRAGERLGWS
jgi:hypothetical protein